MKQIASEKKFLVAMMMAFFAQLQSSNVEFLCKADMQCNLVQFRRLLANYNSPDELNSPVNELGETLLHRVADMSYQPASSSNADDACSDSLRCQHYCEMCKMLLARGANPKSVAQDGKTPLHKAATRSGIICSLLIDRGADVHARDLRGTTPLSEALDPLVPIVDRLAICRVLLDAGARISNLQILRSVFADERIGLPVQQLVAERAAAQLLDDQNWSLDKSFEESYREVKAFIESSSMLDEKNATMTMFFDTDNQRPEQAVDQERLNAIRRINQRICTRIRQQFGIGLQKALVYALHTHKISKAHQLINMCHTGMAVE